MKPTTTVSVALSLCVAAGCAGGPEPEPEPELTTCSDAGAFLAVELAGAIDGAVEPTDRIRCGSIGGGDGPNRGVFFNVAAADDIDWTFDVQGELALETTGDGIDVEVFVYQRTGEDSESWFGDCELAIDIFEPLAAGEPDYWLGGRVHCGAALEGFIPADAAPLRLTSYEFLGIHSDG